MAPLVTIRDKFAPPHPTRAELSRVTPPHVPPLLAAEAHDDDLRPLDQTIGSLTRRVPFVQTSPQCAHHRHTMPSAAAVVKRPPAFVARGRSIQLSCCRIVAFLQCAKTFRKSDARVLAQTRDTGHSFR